MECLGHSGVDLECQRRPLREPVLVLDGPRSLPSATETYLRALRPGYRGGDPADAVYNHGWLIGDGTAISEPLQARIDELLEARPENFEDR